ncbi:MAG: hypothetical protein ACSHXZ_08590 [Gammaproteobacteria bacterium]
MTSINARVWLVCVLAFGTNSSAANAQDFGKIFSTAQQRAYLDRQREELLSELNEQERLAVLAQPVVSESLELAPRLVHMGGVVRKANGNHTVWLNGVPVNSFDLPSNVSLEFQRGMGMLRVRSVSGEYIVRPGQTLNADDGAIREDYELTQEEAETIRQTLAERDALRRSANNSNGAAANTTSAAATEEENVDDAAEMMGSILEALRLMQEAQELQGGAQ